MTTSSNFQKSARLIAAEKKLEEIERKIATERERREAELALVLEQARRDAEAIKQLQTTGQKSSFNVANLVSPSLVSVPVNVNRNTKELPEPALFLLKDLWANLGYVGESFVEMQMEISRELDRADFGRFEREMLCNELIGARTEIHVLREERAHLLKRLELNRENIKQLMETEERTYNTLMSERAASESVIRCLEADIKDLKADKEAALTKVASLSSDLERAEKGRIAAVLYAKGAEDRAATATLIAAEVAANNRRIPTTLSPSSFLPEPPLPPPVLGSSIPSFWTAADDEALKAKLKERTLAIEEEKLLAEGKRLESELAKVKDERVKLNQQNGPNENKQGGQKNRNEGGAQVNKQDESINTNEQKGVNKKTKTQGVGYEEANDQSFNQNKKKNEERLGQQQQQQQNHKKKDNNNNNNGRSEGCHCGAGNNDNKNKNQANFNKSTKERIMELF
ncbi:hypothetical protein O181_014196 [Austropuccinia psidii MF-1]|uniref:Uncharacterized protein n=1 Tax=Austropuccinia psidii MF-1 TaxID=1389203 RepID=A0A9Q3BXP8_9BASI|nr:hypothetical protein [Austropuccinia psidii MF-1]